MSTPPNTERLKELMHVHRLSCKDVAEILNRSVSTVEEWRCTNSRTISANNLKLLELTLRLRGACA